MARRRLKLFSGIAAMADLPGVGQAVYKLNVNGPVVRMMAKGHVYESPDMLTPIWRAEKGLVIDRRGARHASVRFVTGELDLFRDRETFLAVAKEIAASTRLVYPARAPAKSRAEMEALAEVLPNAAKVMQRGKLSFYEEFPGTAADTVLGEIS